MEQVYFDKLMVLIKGIDLEIVKAIFIADLLIAIVIIASTIYLARMIKDSITLQMTIVKQLDALAKNNKSNDKSIQNNSDKK